MTSPDDGLVEKVANVISKPRADEAGGCFCPEPGDSPDDCADHVCYCYRITREEARAAIIACLEAMLSPSKTVLAAGLDAIRDHMDSTQDSYSSWDFPVEVTALEGLKAMIQEVAAENSIPLNPKER